MEKMTNHIVKGMYKELIKTLRPRVGESTQYNTKITEEMIEVLEDRLLQLNVRDMI